MTNREKYNITKFSNINTVFLRKYSRENTSLLEAQTWLDFQMDNKSTIKEMEKMEGTSIHDMDKILFSSEKASLLIQQIAQHQKICGRKTIHKAFINFVFTNMSQWKPNGLKPFM